MALHKKSSLNSSCPCLLNRRRQGSELEIARDGSARHEVLLKGLDLEFVRKVLPSL